MANGLSNREKTILRYIIEDFIQTANPVGSRYISRKKDLNLSPATIRNVMSDLEELDLLTHTHTSGGRIPTDKGYRYFVNELMGFEPLNSDEIDFIENQINTLSDDIYKEISRILGKISKEISVVSQPYLSEGIFEKIEFVSLSSSKILVVVSIKSGIVRTLIFDIDSALSKEKLDRVGGLLNEKLSGISLKEIRKTFLHRVGDLYPLEKEGASKVVKIFIDSIDRIFLDEKEGMTLYIGGTAEVLSQPEFGDKDNYKNIIELTDEKDIVVHVLNSLSQEDESINISIGTENQDEKLSKFSVVCKTYQVGSVKGKIALIGPKRMNYSKMISMLNYTSQIITGKI